MNSFTIKYFHNHDISYTGKELSPHWIREKMSIAGNALVAFAGEASVRAEDLVDVDDSKNNAVIYSPKMLHFIGEFFDSTLEAAILYQHTIILLTSEWLLQQGIQEITRRGNDLYFQSRKLSVSIATTSAVSQLIHVGFNLETHGTPVPTASLKDMGIEPNNFATQLLTGFEREYQVWGNARTKVRPR